MKSAGIYLEDILEAIDKIELYLRDLNQQMFYEDSKTQDAVIRQFEVIGEAAAAYKKSGDQDDSLPWLPMISMRNKLIHEYHGVDLEVVWETANRDLPELRQKVATLLEKSK